MNRRKLLTLLPFLAAPAVLRAEESINVELVELILKCDFCRSKPDELGRYFCCSYNISLKQLNFFKRILNNKETIETNRDAIIFIKGMSFDNLDTIQRTYSLKEVKKSVDWIIDTLSI